jgi:hypothetical protein
LLAFGKIPGAAGQKPQTALQARSHRGRRKELDARCRELDSERKAIEVSTDLADGGRVVPWSSKSGLTATARWTKRAMAG